jgi:hypothetical protein
MLYLVANLWWILLLSLVIGGASGWLARQSSWGDRL